MKTKENKITLCLLSIYIVVLSWIILFKMSFSLSELDHFRNINLIPFYESAVVNNKIDFSEIYLNILAFVPFGIYISMLDNKWSLAKRVVPIAGLSLAYEMLQYILAIGGSDITDVIGNTLGGVCGILIYFILHLILKDDKKINKILIAFASAGTAIVVLGLGMLVIINF